MTSSHCIDHRGNNGGAEVRGGGGVRGAERAGGGAAAEAK